MNASSARDPLVGRTLGEFVLRERIGEGGFGAVYRASQRALDREAVVKVLRAGLHASPAAAERFLREAKLASKLDHPYAAHIYAFGAEPDGELWIAMELVRGTTLDQILRAQGPLSLERLATLLDRLCEVVRSAHDQGIIHRDIKPANVMVISRAGRLLPKLLDFGIAKGVDGPTAPTTTTAPAPPIRPTGAQARELAMTDTLADAATMDPAGAADSQQLTQRGAIMGSPLYMAPEQWLDAGAVDAGTDIYALGVLAYECLTGKPPFSGATITELARAHAQQQPPPLGARLPPALDDVFATALAKQSDRRYRDALAFAAAFRSAAGLAGDTVALPALDGILRDTVIAGAPAPIAESVAMLDAARNAHQARDAVVMVARAITRYLGTLAIACRSRVSAFDEPPGTDARLRQLAQGVLAGGEWLELVHALTLAWTARRDAYPIPELVEAFHDHDLGSALAALLALRDRETPTDAQLTTLLEQAMPQLQRVLEATAFVSAYPLVKMLDDTHAERWMGARRAQHTTMAVRGHELPASAIVILDDDGVPVLSLSPLCQLTAPSAGAAVELFMFEGRDRRGARFVALPSGFEHHDDAVWDWFRAQLASTLEVDETAPAEERPPYRGLSSFSTEDGATFFGRERLVDGFANRLRVDPLLAVVGRSGAGKSSFVKAGVIPALPAGWRSLVIRPGLSPIAALVARLEHAGLGKLTRDEIASDPERLGEHLRGEAGRGGPILLVIDQLEEIFTLCGDAEQRRVFAEAIAAAARTADDPVRVIVTLRDDFLVRTEQLPALRSRISHGLTLLTVPAPDELLRILVEPARRAGYDFDDPDLPQQMIKEVAEQPGALALVSFTAAKLWELRDRHFHRLTRAAYKMLGGVGGALARHADQILDEMSAEEAALAREAFRHLVTSQNTRAVLARKELRELLASPAHADNVIERLVTARLLVASENEDGTETIEIVHEALLAAWPRLVEWRREDAGGAQFREQLRAAAKQWDDRGRARDLLWRGDAFADYTRWRARHTGALTELEAAFVADATALAARGRRNRRLLIASGMTTIAIVVVGLIIFNARIAGQRARAEDAVESLNQNLLAQYEDQGRQLVLAGDPLRALAYLAKAQELGEHGRGHDLLVAEAVEASNGKLLALHHEGAARSPEFSRDGKWLATASHDGTARIWDATTGELVRALRIDQPLASALFTPDASAVLTVAYDGSLVMWDARTGAARVHMHHGSPIECGVLSRDGTLALTAGSDGTAALWSTGDGHLVQRVRGGTDGLTACALSGDGERIAAGDTTGITRVWSANTGELVRELRGGRDAIVQVGFAHDGSRIAAASGDTAVEWDVTTGAALHTYRHGAAVGSVEFSPDDALVLTASDDRTAAIWDSRTGERKTSLAGQASSVTRAAFSPDGRYAVTASVDATAWLWDVHTARVLARWRGHADRVNGIAFDTATRRVATTSDDGSALVWSVEPQTREWWFTGGVRAAQLSHDDHRLVTGGLDGAVRIWDVATRQQIIELRGHVGTVTNVAYSPDDRLLATRGKDGTIRLSATDNSAPPRVLLTGAMGDEATLEWSPDGKWLVSGGEDGWIRCWDASGNQRFAMQGHGGERVFSAVFDPSSRMVVTTGLDSATRTWDLDGHLVREYRTPAARWSATHDRSGRYVVSAVRRRAQIWDPATGATVRELVGNLGFVSDAQWSPDGQWIVTASADGTTRIWDARTGTVLAELAYPDPAYTATFGAHGDRIVVVHADGTALIAFLPEAPPAGALETLLRCRTPYVVSGDQLVTRELPACPRE